MKFFSSIVSKSSPSRFLYNVEQYNAAREELGDVIASIREELEQNKLETVDVKAGYTLSESVAALANKSVGEALNMPLRYESIRKSVYGPSVPDQVRGAAWIYPGQVVSIEDGVVVVRDKSANLQKVSAELASVEDPSKGWDEPKDLSEGWDLPENVDGFLGSVWDTVGNGETWSNLGEGTLNVLKKIGGGLEDVFDGTAYEGLKNHLNKAGDLTMVDILKGVKDGTLYVARKGGEVVIWTGGKVGEGVKYVLSGDEAEKFEQKKEAVEKGFIEGVRDGTVDLYENGEKKAVDVMNWFSDTYDEYLGAESKDVRATLKDYIAGKEVNPADLMHKITNVKTLDENLMQALQVEKVRQFFTGKDIVFAHLESVDAGAYRLMENWNAKSLTFEKLEDLNLPKNGKGEIDVDIEDWSFGNLSFKKVKSLNETEARWLSRFDGVVYLPSLNEDTNKNIIDALDGGKATIRFNDSINGKRLDWNAESIIDNTTRYYAEKDILDSGDWGKMSALESLSTAKYGGMPEGYSETGFVNALWGEVSRADGALDAIDLSGLKEGGVSAEQMSILSRIPVDVKLSGGLKKQLNDARNNILIQGFESGNMEMRGIALALAPLKSIKFSPEAKDAIRNYVFMCCMETRLDWEDQTAALVESYKEVFGNEGDAIRERVSGRVENVEFLSISLDRSLLESYIEQLKNSDSLDDAQKQVLINYFEETMNLPDVVNGIDPNAWKGVLYHMYVSKDVSAAIPDSQELIQEFLAGHGSEITPEQVSYLQSFVGENADDMMTFDPTVWLVIFDKMY